MILICLFLNCCLVIRRHDRRRKCGWRILSRSDHWRYLRPKLRMPSGTTLWPNHLPNTLATTAKSGTISLSSLYSSSFRYFPLVSFWFHYYLYYFNFFKKYIYIYMTRWFNYGKTLSLKISPCLKSFNEVAQRNWIGRKRRVINELENWTS